MDLLSVLECVIKEGNLMDIDMGKSQETNVIWLTN